MKSYMEMVLVQGIIKFKNQVDRLIIDVDRVDLPYIYSNWD